jgi:hypothetical protein
MLIDSLAAEARNVQRR